MEIRTPSKVGTNVYAVFDDGADERLRDATVVLNTGLVMECFLQGHRVLVFHGETILCDTS